MRLRASIKEAVHYCSFPSSQSEADFFPSQCQNFLAVWQNLDALLLTKRWLLLRLEAHHNNWKVFVVTHEPEKQTSQELFCRCVAEQEGMGRSVLTWVNLLLPPNRMSASKPTTGNGPGPQPSPEPCKGVAGNCWLLWAKKSLKDKFKTSLSQC